MNALHEPMSVRERAGAFIPATILILIAMATHASALRGWWLNDDPQVLVQAVRNSVAETLFVPVKWRSLSSSNFTPLVTLSFELDLALAGLRPTVFYGHQILVAILAAVLLQRLLEKYAGTVLGTLGAAAFLVAPSTVVAVRTLMVRHYLEGLVLVLLALLFWRRSVGAPFSTSAWLAALCYFAACLAKEVYAPLPLILIYLSRVEGETWRAIARRLILPSLMALLYLGWRLAMLGSPGGYGGLPIAEDWTRLPFAFVDSVFGSAHLLQVLLLMICAFLATVIAWKKRGVATIGRFILWAGLFTFIPLVPVLSQYQSRHGLVFATVFVSGVTLALGIDRTRRSEILAVIFLGLLTLAGQVERRRHDGMTRLMVAEGRYVWEKPATAPVLYAHSVGWYLDGLEFLRRWSGRGESPRQLLSTEGLILGGIPEQTIVTVRDGDYRPLDLPLRDVVVREKAAFRPTAPIAIRIRREGPVYSWRFQPTGAWRFLSYPDYDELDVPAEGWQRVPETHEQQWFRIRRTLPDGTWTVTPPLPLPANDGVVEWSR